MRALRYLEINQPPRVVDVPDCEPGPDQIVLQVAAAGVCHSDQYVMSLSENDYRARGYPLPMTLGHEGAGIIVAAGADVASQVTIGQSVLVYGPWGCGTCRRCLVGDENYCLRAKPERIFPPGLGRDGSMAEYMVVDHPRHLVPLDGLDPVTHVALTDAGLTPYHAIKRSLAEGGRTGTAAVIGVGGLGHLAIQLLRALSDMTVIALDIDPVKLDLALRHGADHVVLSNADAMNAVLDLTSGTGVDVVLDLVGHPATVETARKVAAPDSRIDILGVGAGALTLAPGALATGATVRRPYWGALDELHELLKLARDGVVTVESTVYSLDDSTTAYADLASGRVEGRAVVVP